MDNFWRKLFNLHIGEDSKTKTLENVTANISFSGANLWILACAILVASVGLNVNSTAVIIGAMLISPLMGPIVASGFAIAIYDFSLLKRAVINLLIATVASLLVSFIYFWLSPFKEVQSELLARTSPNIYDILIAFFGGLVGVIAVTRVEKGNPIPGVAIATALMPPLCTAGYGLATGQFRFFFGAFFLYCINCVFICIATLVIVKYLKYPAKQQLDQKREKQVRYAITLIMLAMIIPSVYFAFTLYKKQQFTQAANRFITEKLTNNGIVVVYKNTNFNADPKQIELAFLAHRCTDEEIDSLNKMLPAYGLKNTRVVVKQDSTDDIEELKSSLLNEIKSKTSLQSQAEAKVKQLEKEIEKAAYDAKQISLEIKPLFPQINAVSIANHTFYDVKRDSLIKIPLLVYDAEKLLSNADKVRLKNWLKKRLALDTLMVVKN
ncbi:DUF389 domain-containing protein [Pedobacter sp. MW01-1-1]|uniref:DUF389 domain-containing protein n=1 Tax=Pedobacter sp. MW01-1-1 TaxID=3383027 RepID=UPI003FF01DD5